MLKLLSLPPGRVPPIPEPGEADRLLPLQRHLGDGLRLPGLPPQKLVSTLDAQGECVELCCISALISPFSVCEGLQTMSRLCWRTPGSTQSLKSTT